MTKRTIVLVLCLIFFMSAIVSVNAQQKTIAFVSRPNYIDVATGEHCDCERLPGGPTDE